MELHCTIGSMNTEYRKSPSPDHGNELSYSTYEIQKLPNINEELKGENKMRSVSTFPLWGN